MKKININYDLWEDIQTPLKNSQSDMKIRSIRSLFEKPKPSIYYPIVADAWERFNKGDI